MSLRPGGVTGIAILAIASAIGAIVAGIIFLVDPIGVKTLYDTNLGPLLAGIPIVGAKLADVGIDTVFLVAIIGLVFGAVVLVTGVGLYKLKKWAYWLAILISIPLILAIIGIVFIWYLRKEEVKAAFDIM